ncbi:WxL domain-containing protein [Leuconostoc falkenbergense]|uniref:WxL domain-containing protein n=1 Tax=Leuconostoc falkenbergense TaxID=2766470 RepID=UPI003F96E1B7
MINKKILGLAGLASLGLATAPLAVVHADDVSTTSNATITFSEDDTFKSVLDPTNPNGGQTSVQPTEQDGDTTHSNGTSGPLTIDFASSLNFENHKISTLKQEYSAFTQKYRDNNNNKQEGPNFVQVTDSRSGSGQGWRLTVSQGNFQATNPDDETKPYILKGAQIHLKNGTYVSGNEATFNNSLTQDNVHSDAILGGAEQELMHADKRTGRGTSLYTMDTKENAAESVTLEVPAGAEKVKDVNYSATLTWKLYDAPSE